MSEYAGTDRNKAPPINKLEYETEMLYHFIMDSRELKRWLKKQGCTFEENRGKGGHITVRLGNNVTVMPMHGQKELPTGTVEAIKKQLGLKGK